VPSEIVALADFVQPTPSGTKRGIGGTCVNVGCIPKKMMHYAANLAHGRSDMIATGWDIQESQGPSWETMIGNITMHIRTLNFGYLMDFNQLGIKYFNEYATFIDAHTEQLEKADGTTQTITAEKIVIAVGGRPTYPEIPGAREFGITSDDLFSLRKPPGKALVVGASYVALESAGFLSALGFDARVKIICFTGRSSLNRTEEPLQRREGHEVLAHRC